MKGTFPPRHPAPYAKVFIVLKSRVVRKNQTLAQGAGCRGGKAPFIYGVISVRFQF